MEGISNADFGALLSCPGMDEKSAQSVLHFFENRKVKMENNKDL